MKRTYKEYILATIETKYTSNEAKQLTGLILPDDNGKLEIQRQYSHSSTWLHPRYTVDTKSVPVSKELRKQIADLEATYRSFKKELDYLSHFLSVVFRSNVPESTIHQLIPEHIFKAFRQDDYRNCISLRRTPDESITAEVLKEQYPTEAFYLNKYLIFLML